MINLNTIWATKTELREHPDRHGDTRDRPEEYVDNMPFSISNNFFSYASVFIKQLRQIYHVLAIVGVLAACVVYTNWFHVPIPPDLDCPAGERVVSWGEMGPTTNGFTYVVQRFTWFESWGCTHEGERPLKWRGLLIVR